MRCFIHKEHSRTFCWIITAHPATEGTKRPSLALGCTPEHWRLGWTARGSCEQECRCYWCPSIAATAHGELGSVSIWIKHFLQV